MSAFFQLESGILSNNGNYTMSALFGRMDGARKPEVIAQHDAFVVRAEQPAFLEFRHESVERVMQPLRIERDQEIEAVASAAAIPLLDMIVDGLCRAD